MCMKAVDLEPLQTFFNQSPDPGFYDDFYNFSQPEEEWKPSQKLLGLPTPPSSPDKTSRFANFPGNITPGLQEVPCIDNFNPRNEGLYNVDMFCGNPLNKMHDTVSMQNQGKHSLSYGYQPYNDFTQPARKQKYAFQLQQQNAFNHDFTPYRFPFNSPNLQYHSQNFPPQYQNSIRPQPTYPPFNIVHPTMQCEDLYYHHFGYKNIRTQKPPCIMDIEPELSRATHNVLERQRRNDLKIRFNMLRDNIPELTNNQKAPKIQILKKSIEHLKQLKAQEQKLLADLELEKQRRKILLRRAEILQRN